MGVDRQDEKEIFWKAAEIQSPEERKAYLDRACGEDAELRAAVEKLLSLHASGRQLFMAPVLAADDTLHVSAPSEKPGDVIGHYKLLQKIGEGGFAVVYMALQMKPVRRRVALKIIKVGMQTSTVIARFEAERQAMALMDHPNIAQVFDAGATATGRPYFAMELVHGIPITEYCDQNNLDLRERLELFTRVCSALQHAHQKGIIHRDLKPTNVLVTLHGDTPVPKVIDFGIAKAMDRPLTDKTLYTVFGAFVGTPQYMSPEQAALSGLDVDTRSDIYSLGVLLYELLTGTTPFEPERLRGAAYDEVCRVLREVDPPTPSSRITTLGEGAEEVAHHRHAEPALLGKLIQGDLDWIVMKALEKDRTRRYETASALADDVMRHLDDQPVLAGPPGAGYRIRKFVRRNRVKVIAGLLVAASLAVGLGMASFAMVQAFRQRGRALAAYQAQQEAQQQAERDRRAARAREEEAQVAGRRAQAEHEAKQKAEQALSEEGRWRLIAAAQAQMREENYRAALRALQSAAAVRHDRVTRLLFWRLAQLYRDDGQPVDLPGCIFSPDGRYATSERGGYRNVPVKDLLTGEMRAIGQHQDFVFPGAFSPDGKLLATPGGDSVVQVCSVQTGAVLHTLEGHTSKVYGTAFAPDGSLLASGSEDGTVRLWDVASGRQVRSIDVHGIDVRSAPEHVLFSRDGILLLVVGWDGLVSLWAPDSGQSIASSYGGNSLPQGTGSVWHPGGGIAATSHEPNVVRFWDVPGLRSVCTVRTPDSRLGAIALSPDGRTLALGGQDSIRLWDIAGRRFVPPVMDGSGVRGLAFSPDGSALFSDHRYSAIEVRDLTDGRMVRTIRAAFDQWPQLRSGGRTVSVNDGISDRLWDVASGERLSSPPAGRPAGASWASRAPKGERQATWHKDGVVRIVSAPTGKELHALSEDYGGVAPTPAFSPDGRVLALAGHGVRLWDAETGQQLRTLDLGLPRTEWPCLRFSPDGKLLAYARPGLHVWDVDAGEEPAWAARYHATGNTFEFSPNGRVLAVGTREGVIDLVDPVTGALRASLRGHRGSVFDLWFNPDASKLASGAEDEEGDLAILWDVQTGKEISRLEVRAFRSLTFTPEGHALLAASSGAGMRRWGSVRATAFRKLAGHFRPVPTSHGLYWMTQSPTALAVSPDGSTLAWSGADWRIRLADTATGRQRLVLQGHTDRVNGLAFSPDGSLLASAGQDACVKLWDPASGMLLRSIPHECSLHAVCFSPDGSSLLAGNLVGATAVWDVASGERTLTQAGQAGMVDSVATGHQGELAATGSAYGNVRVWRLDSGEKVSSFGEHAGGANALAFLPGSSRVAWPHRDGSVRLCDGLTGKEERMFSLPRGKALRVAVSPDGSLLAAGTDGGAIALWRLPDGQEARTIEAHRGAVSCLAFVGGRGQLLSGGADGRLMLWDLSDGTGRNLLTGSMSCVADLAYSPDGRCLAAAECGHTIRIWDLVSGGEAAVLDGPAGSPETCAYSPDGRTLAGGYSTGRIVLWDAVSWKELNTLKGPGGGISCVEFGPDGKLIASAGRDGNAVIWDVGSGARVREMPGHAETLNAVTFSQDGRQLATGGADGVITVWDVASGSELASMGLGEGAGTIWSLAYSPDGRVLASGGTGGLTDRLWDASTGRLLRVLAAHPGGTCSLEFSPDGRFLAGGGGRDDGAVYVWDVATGNEVLRMPTEDKFQVPVAFSPDGRELAVGSGGDVLVYDLTAHQDAIDRWVSAAGVQSGGKEAAGVE